jgi:uncharacterized protein
MLPPRVDWVGRATAGPGAAGGASCGKMGRMAGLKDRLRGDLTAAMKARDEVRTRTLRMALTSIANEEVAGSGARDLDDDEILRLLAVQAKRRMEAADAFASAGRTGQAAAERAEEDVLRAYLPAQLSDTELAAIVAEVIAETGASGIRSMGQVMKAITPKLAGRAEGRRVADQVRRALADQEG